MAWAADLRGSIRGPESSDRELDLTIGTLPPILDNSDTSVPGPHSINYFACFLARFSDRQSKGRPCRRIRHFNCQIAWSHSDILRRRSRLGWAERRQSGSRKRGTLRFQAVNNGEHRGCVTLAAAILCVNVGAVSPQSSTAPDTHRAPPQPTRGAIRFSGASGGGPTHTPHILGEAFPTRVLSRSPRRTQR
jgi:hypothetical protein